MLTEKVRSKVRETLEKAETIWNRKFAMPTVDFNLKGATAGKAFWPSNRISINYPLLSRNGDTFVNSTVPHEVAHLVTHVVYGNGVDPHGPEWATVMRRLGYIPKRCHSYDVTGLVRKQMRYEYICNCRAHKVSSTMHNRIMRGAQYKCKQCQTKIRKEGGSMQFGARVSGMGGMTIE